ncbi:MAG: T9SS type A sorting domain-containing protein [Bacteroidota bacterium]
MKMHFTKMLTVCCAILFGAFITTGAMAQSGGETCATAQAVTPGAYTVDSVTTGVGAELNCFLTTPTGDHNARWYSYTPSANGTITVSACQGGADTRLSIGTGTCGALTCEAASDDICPFAVDGTGSSFASEVLDLPVASGVTYLIQWDNRWSSAGFDWSLSFTEVTEPDCEGVPGGTAGPGTSCDDGDAGTVGDVYDEFCVCAGVAPGNCLNTSPFASADLSTAGSNLVTFATNQWQTEYSTTTGVPAGEDIEFTYDSPGAYITVRSDSATGPVVAQGFSPVTVMMASGADLFAHYNTDDACGTATIGNTSTVQCTSCAATCPDGSNPGDACDPGDGTVGNTVQSDCSCSGGFIPVANDNCSDVASLLPCGGSVDGTTVNASAETDLNNTCNGFTSTSPEGVWYAFQSDGNSSYTIAVDTNAATNGSLMDAVIYVYSGPCGDLTELACADDNFSFDAFSGESVTLSDLPAGIYYVRVYNWNAGGEPFTISLTCESNCQDPFPAVDEGSLMTAIGGGGVGTSWAPVAGQIGCQVQLRLAGGAVLGAAIVGGAGASSLTIPGSVLSLGTDYEWRVRCGCSQTPLVAGPFSSWQPFSTPGGAAIVSQPNPTEGQSNVTFSVVEEGYTTLEVFDMSGRLVDALFTGTAIPDADYRFEFDGSSLPNGVYLYRLTTENEVLNEKFMIAR